MVGAKEITTKESVVFGTDLGLFLSTLFKFYQFATYQVKKKFLEKLVIEKLLRFEKELVMSLSGFLMFLIPALEDNSQENVSKAYEILAQTEKFVGTSKLYGEIWKTVLRTPKARLPALRYMDRRIPKNIDEAISLNDGSSPVSHNSQRSSRIYPSKYNLVIRNGKMYVETCEYQDNVADMSEDID